MVIPISLTSDWGGDTDRQLGNILKWRLRNSAVRLAYISFFQFHGLLLYFKNKISLICGQMLLSFLRSLCTLLEKIWKYILGEVWLTVWNYQLFPFLPFAQDTTINFPKAIRDSPHWRIQYKLYLYSEAKSCLKQYSSHVRKSWHLSWHLWERVLRIMFKLSQGELHMKNINSLVPFSSLQYLVRRAFTEIEQ